MKKNKTTKAAAKCDKCSAPISMEFRMNELENKIKAALSLIDSSDYRIDKIKEYNQQVSEGIMKLKTNAEKLEYAIDEIERLKEARRSSGQEFIDFQIKQEEYNGELRDKNWKLLMSLDKVICTLIVYALIYIFSALLIIRLT